jgi:hypothetical protein
LSPTISPTPGLGGGGTGSNSGNALSNGAIAGIVIGSIAIAFAIGYAIWWYFYKEGISRKSLAVEGWPKIIFSGRYKLLIILYFMVSRSPKSQIGRLL